MIKDNIDFSVRVYTKRLVKRASVEPAVAILKSALEQMQEYYEKGETNENKYFEQIDLVESIKDQIKIDDYEIQSLFYTYENFFVSYANIIKKYKQKIDLLNIGELIDKWRKEAHPLKVKLTYEKLEEKIQDCDNKGDLAIALIDDDEEIREMAQQKYGQLEMVYKGIKQFVLIKISSKRYGKHLKWKSSCFKFNAE